MQSLQTCITSCTTLALLADARFKIANSVYGKTLQADAGASCEFTQIADSCEAHLAFFAALASLAPTRGDMDLDLAASPGSLVLGLQPTWQAKRLLT